MKISTEQGLLEVPQDFEFEIKVSHPFFSDEGAASIPVTIPATVANCAILGYPERADRLTRYPRETTAFAECGVFRKQCKVITESAGKGSGITLCLALAESEMYIAARDKTLKELLAGYTFGSTRTTPARPTDAYHSLHLYGFGYAGIDFPFALFPVATDITDQGHVFVMNRPNADGEILAPARTITVGDRTISVGTGYGVAPYIFLWAMIELAFEQAGFGIGSNVFKTDEDLKHIAVVHNRADVCLGSSEDGTLWGFHYADLVPDMTLGDLIVWLHDKFGAVVRQDSGGIYISLMRDLLTGTPDYDLTSIQIDDETISYPSPSMLERSTDTSIQSANPPAETLELLREIYANCAEAASYEAISGTGLFYVPPMGKYYLKDSSGKVTTLGSASFTYKRASSLDYEKLSTEDPFLPMVVADGLYMPYIGERTHINVETGEEPKEQPLQICYAHDNLDTSSGYEAYTMSGSSFSYDRKGNVINKRNRLPSGSIQLTPHPALTPEGLAPLWSGYEKILMNGAPEISLECIFPMADLVTLDLTTPKLFKGCHALIKELTYKVTPDVATKAKMTLQLIPNYTDMQTPASVLFNRDICWSLKSTRSVFAGSGYTIDSTDGLTDYTADDEPQYTPKTTGLIVKKRSRWLKYTYTKKVKKWWGTSTSSFFDTHRWEEYFISQSL